MNDKGIIVSIKEASRILCTSKGDVYKLINSDIISSIKESDRTFVYLSEIKDIKKKRKIINIVPQKIRNIFERLVKILWDLKYAELSVLSIALLGLLLQYFVTNPVIIIDKINDVGPTPFDHEFIIKNSGSTSAKNLQLIFISPHIKWENELALLSAPEGETVFARESIISGVDIPPDQEYQFKLDTWIKLDQTSQRGISKAKFNLEIKYKDFLFLPHQTNFSFKTFQEQGKLIWKKVGPRETW